VRGVVKVSKLVENEPFRETYWTEAVEMTVNTADGKKLFQSFHVVAVPEGGFEEFQRLRKTDEGILDVRARTPSITRLDTPTGSYHFWIKDRGNVSSSFPMISVIKRFSAFLRCSTRVDLTMFNVFASCSESTLRGTS
jgi:hypothetical protein